MIEWILKPAILLALAGLVHAFARRAAVRHFGWTLAFAALLLMPLLPPVPTWKAKAPVRVPVTLQVIDPGFVAPEEPAPAKTAVDVRTIVLLIWLAGSLVCIARLTPALRTVRKLTVEARPAGTHNGVPILEHDAVTTPFTWGHFRPVILLPSSQAVEWSADRRQHVLAHEYAHIRRHDWTTQCMAQLACVLYWFHPLAWIAANAMRRASEQACDDAVVRDGHTPEGYAEHLLELAQQQETASGNPGPSLVVPMWDRSQLEERIMKILEHHDRRSMGRLAAGLMTAMAIVSLAPIAMVRIQAQSPAEGKLVLQGVVNDPSGARVPGAKIIAKVRTNPDAPAGSEAAVFSVSAQDGTYRMEIPRGGPVHLVVEVPGFMKAERTLTLATLSGDVVSRDFTLSLGQIAETVRVAGVRPAGMVVASTAPTRIRVGGNVQAANLVRKTNPEYPKDLQAQNIEGTVELEAVISKEGNILNLHPKSKLVHEGLIHAATAAVSTWQYQPTLLNGAPVEIVTTITVRFYLQ